MRILILHSSSVSKSVSGEYNVFKNESDLFKKSDHIVSSIEYGPSNIKNTKLHLAYYLANSIFSLKAFFFIRKHIKDFKPDVVHFHGLFPFLTFSSIYAAKRKGITVVLTLHNVGFICGEGGFYKNNDYCDICLKGNMFNGVINNCYKNRFGSFVKYLINTIAFDFNFLNRNVDKFISVSDFIKDVYVIKGLIPSKVFTKYNHINSNRSLLPDFRLKQGITFVGRLTRSKGTETLIFIMKAINIHFNIIGDGPEINSLKYVCKKFNLKNVHFYGNLNHDAVLNILKYSLCTIIPSICAESFSLVAAESFSVGTPVVAYDVGGLGDLVKKSGAGKTCKVNDFTSFLDYINFYVNNFEENLIAGERGKKFVSSELCGSITYFSLLNIYNSNGINCI